jgi:uncharacterized protein
MHRKPVATEPKVDDRPWWRYGMVWLVIGGPALVVVAAIGTAVVAVRGADPVVTAPAASRAGATVDAAQTPAVQARNRGAGPPPSSPAQEK